MSWFDCEHPKLVRNRYTGDLLQVPCGECYACKVKRISRWIAPLANEAQCWKHVFFFTLTYNDRFLPKYPVYSYIPKNAKDKKRYYELLDASKEYVDMFNGYLPYCPTGDIQLFLKRLREEIYRQTGRRNTFRYFISSDYGSTLFRPHWHGELFTSDDYVSSNIETLLYKAWAIYNSSRRRRYPIGIVEVEPAISAGKYVSAYIQAIDKLPSIYEHDLFRPHSLKSCAPSIGSLVSTLESPRQIVETGLTEVNVYDARTFQWRRVCLSSSLVRRYFPSIPSFSSLSAFERYRIYRFCDDCASSEPKRRRRRMRQVMAFDTFFNDYVTLNNDGLTIRQINDKLDRIFYAYKRLFLQSQLFGVSLKEYDSLICQYFSHRYKQSLTKQFHYESDLSKSHDMDYVNSVIDLAYSTNERGLDSLKGVELPSRPSPKSVDSEFFFQSHLKYNKFVKRKCDNAYLEKHPEYKKFHQ